MAEFRKWPETTRLFRDIVVTEKIDGTNSAIHVEQGSAYSNPAAVFDAYPLRSGEVWDGQHVWRVVAQSRNRIITPESDNFGFAAWVHANALDLASLLGPGLHFGEWWGRGIQRRYGMDEKRFSLFNTSRWTGEVVAQSNKDYDGSVVYLDGGSISAVPVLYEGVFSEQRIFDALYTLEVNGSVAAPGFMKPEGVCIYHTKTKLIQKVTLDGNDKGKWERG